MTKFHFDDRDIRWQTLGDIDHLQFYILGIDRVNSVVDVLFRFAAGQQIVLHRHLVQNNMLVIQGEHRLYAADGRLKEVRPAGRYTVSGPDPEPHREGGGDQDVIILFSIRGSRGSFYEILDDRQCVSATLGLDDFVKLYAAQQQTAATSAALP